MGKHMRFLALWMACALLSWDCEGRGESKNWRAREARQMRQYWGKNGVQ